MSDGGKSQDICPTPDFSIQVVWVLSSKVSNYVTDYAEKAQEDVANKLMCIERFLGIPCQRSAISDIVHLSMMVTVCVTPLRRFSHVRYLCLCLPRLLK